MGMRNANIGLAVGLTVLFVGAFLCRHSEGALQVVLLAAFVAAFGTHHFLDEREKRRSRRDQ
jgi:hypothetical protein